MTEKSCSTCQRLLPLEHFYVQTMPSGKTYARGECRTCKREKHKAWSKTPRGRAVKRRGVLAREFGLSPEAYERMRAEQNGVCAICFQPETKKHWKGKTCDLAVDHDHSTGKVRALLCQGCNAAIGLFREEPERMRRAAAYLESHQAEVLA